MNEEEIFAAVIQKCSVEARVAYLDEVCSDDSELRARIEGLLDAYDHPDSFLEPSIREGICDAIPNGLDISLHRQIIETCGSIIGPYKLVEQIGEGGFGVVFMAEQERPVRRKVALKVIKPGMDTRQVIARFEAERQALAMMDHPNIAKVLDAGATEGGRPYFVMELVHGIPITEYCDQCNLTTRERLELFVTVCHAVQHAHQKGVIHRDIKPTNVLVSMQDGRPAPKIIDFGVAKALNQRLTEHTVATGYSQMIGTPLYMSPEQAELSPLGADTRSDIYSLGVLLYELITGSTPFDKDRLQAASYDELRRIIREEDPPLPSARLSTLAAAQVTTVADHHRTNVRRLLQSVRGDLDWIALKCLEKDRTRRYATANGLAQDVNHYLNDESVQACPPTARYRFRKFARRNKVALVTAAIVSVSLLSGTIVSIWQATLARRAESLAETRLQQASAISDTLQQMLQSADPYEGKGAEYTVRQMLDDFSAGLGDRLRDQPATEATIRAMIGETYRQLDLIDKAEPHLKAALELRRAAFGGDHELVAHSLIDYAWLCRARGDSIAAEKLAREALAIQQKLDAPDKTLMLANLQLLQVTLSAQRRYDEAEKIGEQALAITRAQSETLPGEASIRRTLADIAAIKGDYGKAETLAREALALHRKLHGDNHLATAAGWEALGYVCYRQNKLDDAENCFRTAQAIFVKSHGYCPINVLSLLAAIFEAKGDQASIAELRPPADNEEEKSGPAGRHKAASRGALRAALGDWEKAKDYLAMAVDLAPDDQSEDSAWHRYMLALICLKTDDRTGYRAACLAGLKHQSIKNDPACYFVVWAGVIAPDSGIDPARLVELAESIVEHSPEDPGYLTAYGAALFRNDRWEEARTALTKAVHAYDSFHGKIRGNVSSAQILLAITNHRLGESKQAREWLTKAMASPAAPSQSDYGGMTWDRRLTTQLLRQEAERLSKDKRDDAQ
jgi:eukaryotic-like serine/threonine-protein kinase